MLSVQRMTFDYSESSLDPDKRQVGSYRESASVKQNVMVRTEAEDVILAVGSIVRRAEGTNMCALRVWTLVGLKAIPADLAPVLVQLLDPPRHHGVPDNARDRLL